MNLLEILWCCHCSLISIALLILFPVTLQKWMRIVGEFSHCPVQGMKVLMCIIAYMPEHSQNTMSQMDIKENLLGVKLHLIQIWKLHVLVDDVLVKIPGNIIVYKQNLYKYVHKFQNELWTCVLTLWCNFNGQIRRIWIRSF